MDDESDESLRLSDSEDDGFGTVIQSKDFSLGKNSSSSGVQNVTNEVGSSTTLPSHASQDFTNQLLVSSRGYKNPNLLQPWERGLMAKVFSKSDPVVPFAKLVQPQPFTIVTHPTDSRVQLSKQVQSSNDLSFRFCSGSFVLWTHRIMEILKHCVRLTDGE